MIYGSLIEKKKLVLVKQEKLIADLKEGEKYPLISLETEGEEIRWSVVPCSLYKSQEEEEEEEKRKEGIPTKGNSNLGVEVNGIFYLSFSDLSKDTLSALQVLPLNSSLKDLCKNYLLFHQVILS